MMEYKSCFATGADAETLDLVKSHIQEKSLI